MRIPMQQKQHGITLVELMVALAVSAILLAGVGIIYGNSKRTYTVDEEFAHLQENARIAMKFLVEDIRMAGNLGCAKNDGSTSNFACNVATTALGTNGNYICTATPTLNPSGLQGFEATGTGINNSVYTLTVATAPDLTVGANTDWSATLPAQFPDNSGGKPGPVKGSDIIAIHLPDQNVFKLSAPSTSTQFTVTAPAGTFAVNNVLLATDCANARVFPATAVADAAGIATITTATTTTFSNTNSEIMKYLTHVYYVAKGAAGPSLWRHDGVAADYPEELVGGVENMQILYGIDTDATPDGVANRYDTANNIDFTTARIVSVRISLLMRNEKALPHYAASHADYLMAGGTTATGTTIRNADDQRIRKVFTTTIKIRNKGL